MAFLRNQRAVSCAFSFGAVTVPIVSSIAAANKAKEIVLFMFILVLFVSFRLIVESYEYFPAPPSRSSLKV
jgi:hypothetical protein